MDSISPFVRSYAATLFAARSSEVVEQLAALNQPPPEPNWAATRERVQMAVLLLSAGGFDRLEKALKVAATDWRDVLVSAGLADADWQAVLARKLPPGLAQNEA